MYCWQKFRLCPESHCGRQRVWILDFPNHSVCKHIPDWNSQKKNVFLEVQIRYSTRDNHLSQRQLQSRLILTTNYHFMYFALRLPAAVKRHEENSLTGKSIGGVFTVSPHWKLLWRSHQRRLLKHRVKTIESRYQPSGNHTLGV